MNSFIISLCVTSTNLFAGTDHGVYLSSDFGVNWSKVNNGFPDSIQIWPLITSRIYLFAGTYDGKLWRRPLSELIPSAVSSSNQPSQFHLNQNYPNPFSSSTNIPFDLPERTFVSIKVYDITGREVAVLANKTLDAGSYSRTLNAEGIPSGTYICRLEAGVYRQERTLFLLK